MSCYCDVETAESWRESTPRAKRDYHCDECGGTICAGESYSRIDAVMRGIGWESWKAHTLCRRLADEMQADCDVQAWGVLYEIIGYGEVEIDTLQPELAGHAAGLMFGQAEQAYDRRQQRLREWRERQEGGRP